MYKYIIYLNSLLIIIIGGSYYFEFLLLQEQSLKLYGLLLLIFSVLLWTSQLMYLPKLISNRILMSSTVGLILLQLMLFIDWFLVMYKNQEDLLHVENYLLELTPAIFILVICIMQISFFIYKQKQLKKRKKLKSA